MTRVRLIFPLFCTLFLERGVQANIGGELAGFFKQLGSAANVSNPSAYHDQTAGYYTGGNLFVRNSVHTSNFATIQPPDLRAGCGGIDAFTGAFSYLSSAELVKAFKAIGSNMGSYALLLAIETMSPVIKNTLTELHDLVQRINQANINSCELAATTLGAVWPKTDASQRHLCKVIGSNKSYGGFSDYAASKQGCGAEGRRKEVLNAAKGDSPFNKMLGVEFNLAWKAIQENAWLQSNRTLAEFFLSVSGTIISRDDAKGSQDAPPTIETKISLADKDALLSALLYGGKAEVYQCNETQSCLNVTKTPLAIEKEKSLVELVRQILVSIKEKIYDDTPLSPAEIAFLNSTRLPFYKILNVATAYRQGSSPIDILDYAELAAIDVLFQYLSEILDVIQESLEHLKLVQVDETQLSSFQEALRVARARIVERRMGSFKQIEQVISIVAKTQLLEKSLHAKVGTISAEGL